MANATELREMLGNLTTLVTNFVSSVEADRKRAADAAAPIPTTPVTPDVTALTAALTQSNAHKDYNGQTIRRADFDIMNPGEESFSLPAEPRNAIDHAMIVKNESTVYKHIDRNRVDPRKAARSHWDKTFVSKINSPFKTVVFEYPSYEDYVRNTDMFYTAMCVFYCRIMPGGTCQDWIDDSSPHIMWNAFTKETLKVKREAFIGDDAGDGGRHRQGFEEYLTDVRRRLDNGENLEQPPAKHRELRDKIDAHNSGPASAKRRPVLPDHQDWGVRQRHYAKNANGTPRVNPDGTLVEYGGYEQVNYMFDRNVVLSKGEFRALALVLGDAYHKFCSKGETHETGRTDELLCAEKQNSLSRTLPPNYLYEIRQAYFDAYPESQRDLVMRIRSAVKSFKFDRSLIKLSMYINQFQLAQSSLVKHGDAKDSISDDDILKDVRTVLHAHFTTLPPEQADSLNLEYKTLAESDAQLDLLSSDHKHKHVFDSLSKLKQEILRIEDLHPHAARIETVPDYLYVPTPKEPTPLPKSRFYALDDGGTPSDALHRLDDAIVATSGDSLMSMPADLHEALLAGRLAGSAISKFAQKNRDRPRDLRVAESRRHESAERRRSSFSPGGMYDSTPHLGGHPHSSRGGDDSARNNKFARALSKAHNNRNRSKSLPPRTTLRQNSGPRDFRRDTKPQESRERRDPSRRDGAKPADSTRREYIPKKPYLALRRVIELAQKSAGAPTTSDNNLKEAAEVCGEALKFLDDNHIYVLDEPDDDGTYDLDRGQAESKHDDEALQQHDDVPDQVAAEAGMTESEATKFAALYAQIEHIDRDLTPAELYAFTMSAMQQLDDLEHEPRLYTMTDVDDGDRGEYMFGPKYRGDDAADGKPPDDGDHGEYMFGPEFSSDDAADGKPPDDDNHAQNPAQNPSRTVTDGGTYQGTTAAEATNPPMLYRGGTHLRMLPHAHPHNTTRAELEKQHAMNDTLPVV